MEHRDARFCRVEVREASETFPRHVDMRLINTDKDGDRKTEKFVSLPQNKVNIGVTDRTVHQSIVVNDQFYKSSVAKQQITINY